MADGLCFSTLLDLAGITRSSVRLLRHQDTRYPGYPSPYAMWRDDLPRFEAYQATQSFADAPKLAAPYWASFVGTADRGTLFVGLYHARLMGPLPADRAHPVTDGVEVAGSCNIYDLHRGDQLADYAGRLSIEWGDGYRAWIQRADRGQKPVVELTRAFKDPPFPGFSALVLDLSRIMSLPPAWKAVLSSTRGIYLLTCPRTKEQYVGSAGGQTGLLGRWLDYAVNGHGGNVGLKSRVASDYQVSILETVGSSTTMDDLVRLEELWKQKLQSRAMGLNKN